MTPEGDKRLRRMGVMKRQWPRWAGFLFNPPEQRISMSDKKLLARAYEVKTLQETERLYDD